MLPQQFYCILIQLQMLFREYHLWQIYQGIFNFLFILISQLKFF
jgi:hypothetical protein